MARFELVIESGAGSGTKLPLPPDGTVTLGGGDDASLHLPGGPTMARYLVSLELQPDGVLAKEVPGRGTIGINGKLVAQGPMKVGDRLRLGITVLRLAEGTGAAAVAPPPAAPAAPPGVPGGTLPRPRLPTPGGGGLPLPRPRVPTPMGAALVAQPPGAPAVAPAPAVPPGPAMSAATPSAPPAPRPAPPPAPAPAATASAESDDEDVDLDLDSGESEELDVEMSEAELRSHREAQAKVERERTEAEIRARVRIVEEPSFVIADDLLDGADDSPDLAAAIKSVPAPAITTEDDDFGGLDGPEMDTGLPRLDAVPTPKRPSARPPAALAAADDFDVSIDDDEEVDLEVDAEPEEEEPSAPRPMPVAMRAVAPSADSTGKLEAVDLEDVDPLEASIALQAAPEMPSAPAPAPAVSAPPAAPEPPASAPPPAAPAHSGSIPAGIDWTGLPTLSVEDADARRDLPEGIPERLGDWELVRPIGQGAMATVYEAAHVESRVHAALKVLQPEPPPPPAIVERFVREQRINQQLLHPRIARCYAVGAARSWLYIAMEYVPGGDASDLVSPYSNVGLALRLGADLFTALAAGHAAGVIHRDVKPANLLLTENDAIGMPHGKLTDFGLAKAFSSGERPITRMGEAGGSLLMMAPEQLLNFSQAGPSADLYSAAATIYRLLTADTHLVLPCDFTDATYAQVGQAITEVARVPLMARRSDAPPAICLLIDMLVACDPVQRRSMTADGVAQQFAYWADMYGCGPVDG